jgi:hypothetical protein
MAGIGYIAIMNGWTTKADFIAVGVCQPLFPIVAIAHGIITGVSIVGLAQL